MNGLKRLLRGIHERYEDPGKDVELALAFLASMVGVLLILLLLAPLGLVRGSARMGWGLLFAAAAMLLTLWHLPHASQHHPLGWKWRLRWVFCGFLSLGACGVWLAAWGMLQTTLDPAAAKGAAVSAAAACEVSHGVLYERRDGSRRGEALFRTNALALTQRLVCEQIDALVEEAETGTSPGGLLEWLQEHWRLLLIDWRPAPHQARAFERVADLDLYLFDGRRMHGVDVEGSLAAAHSQAIQESGGWSSGALGIPDELLKKTAVGHKTWILVVTGDSDPISVPDTVPVASTREGTGTAKVILVVVA